MGLDVERGVHFPVTTALPCPLPQQSFKLSRFAPISGTSTGKSRVDTTGPVDPVATTLASFHAAMCVKYGDIY